MVAWIGDAVEVKTRTDGDILIPHTGLYESALSALSAANLSGLAHGLEQATTLIRQEAEINSQGTDYVNQHPVVLLYLSQMMQLSGYGIADPEVFGPAYQTCLRRAALR